MTQTTFFLQGERVRFKVGRGWSEGVVVLAGADRVRIRTDAGAVVCRKLTSVKQVEAPVHSE